MSGNVYRYLDTLITAGSFSKAARVLQISQPSISQFVHRLETEVGTQLVDRTAKPLRLTYAGECFMKTEREIEQLRSMRSRLIADIGEGVRGHVTIGSSHYRSTFFLAEVLPIFRREYPGVTVSLAEGTTKELEDFAFDGVTDLSLVIAPLYRSELEYAELFRERYLLAMSPESRVAKTVAQPASGGYASMPFNRLNGEPFITIKQGQKVRQPLRRSVPGDSYNASCDARKRIACGGSPFGQCRTWRDFCDANACQTLPTGATGALLHNRAGAARPHGGGRLSQERLSYQGCPQSHRSDAPRGRNRICRRLVNKKSRRDFCKTQRLSIP